MVGGFDLAALGWVATPYIRSVCSLVFVTGFAGLQPVLVHLSKNKDGKFSFDPISVNLLTELAKTIFALVVLLILVSTIRTSRASSA